MRFALLLGALAFCLMAGPSRAQTSFSTTAEYAILIDFDSGAVLFEKRPDDLMHPASMSKLMTLEVVFRKLKDGEITLETEFPVSEHAWRTGGGPSGTSAMFTPLNSSVPVGELLQGIAVQSGNDASIVLAEGLAGTEEAFAMLMTNEARRIGLQKSVFGNSTGLSHPNHLMTARELALLAIHLIKEYPEYYHLFAQREYKYRRHNFINRNPLIYGNIGADGLKTGFISEAGYGITASAVRDGRRLVLVMNGFKTERDRREEATRLFNWGFTNFRSYTVFTKGETVGDVRVWGGDRRFVSVVAENDIKILLPITARDRERRVRAEIAYLGPIKPPVKKGDRVGELRLTSEAGTSNAAPVLAAESVEAGGIVTKGLHSILELGLAQIETRELFR
jgi:D-alanyl-D-alanine carboxypeptidase (penicillin-binding protein 5/6)